MSALLIFSSLAGAIAGVSGTLAVVLTSLIPAAVAIGATCLLIGMLIAEEF